jgi:hypothetical protein
MTFDPSDGRGPINRPGTRSNTTGWVLGAIAAIAVIAAIFWSMGGGTNTAGTASDTNTGATRPPASQAAPAPGTTNGPGPGAPSRP